MTAEPTEILGVNPPRVRECGVPACRSEIRLEYRVTPDELSPGGDSCPGQTMTHDDAVMTCRRRSGPFGAQMAKDGTSWTDSPGQPINS